MREENLQTLKIHKLSKEQKKSLKDSGELNENEIYLVDNDEEIEKLSTDLNSHIEDKDNPHDVGLDDLGVEVSSQEINYLAGVNNNIQTQLDTIEGEVEELQNKDGELETSINGVNSSLSAHKQEINAEIEVVKGDLTSHATSSNAQFGLVREEFAAQDTENLKTAKEYSDANKNSAVDEAKAYTDQEIEKLVTDTEFEGVLSTIQDIQNAMATDEELAQALETANGKKVDKGAKGSIIKPIYFDENGAQEIAYTIEKSVPADAKFTDTTYTLIKDATQKKIQLMNGDKLVSEVDDNNTTYSTASQLLPGLMSAEDKTKLDGIDEGANKTIIDSELSGESENPVQNKIVKEALDDKLSFDEEVVNSTSDVSKIVPEGSGKYAGVNKVGGMSYKSRNLLNVPQTITLSSVGYAFQNVPIYLNKGNYIFSCEYEGNVPENCAISVWDNNTTTARVNQTFYMNSGRKLVVPFTIETSENLRVYLYQNSAQGTIKNCQIESGTQATSYEPYYSGLRNAYVSKIKSEYISKNLCKPERLNTMTHNGASNSYDVTTHTITMLADDTISATGRYGFPFSSFEIGKEYTLSFDIKGTAGKVVRCGWDRNYITITLTNQFTRYSATITAYKEAEPIIFYSTPTANGGLASGEYMQFANVQIERGTEATEYEPYKETEFIIPTGAKEVGYGLGINEDCYNYIDFERKVYVQRCKEVNLSTLSWNYVTASKVFWASFPNMKTDGIGLSDIYTVTNWSNAENMTLSKHYTFNSEALNLVDTRYTDVTSLKAALADSWLIYELATPIETDISDYVQDNFIEVAAGGVITAVNEYGYDAPTEISFYTSENPEKVIVADKIVGDLVGIADKAKSIEGVTGNIQTSIEQSWEWTGVDEDDAEYVYIQPPEEGYNRCEIWLYEKREETGDYVAVEGSFIPYIPSTGNFFVGPTYQRGEVITDGRVGKENGHQGTLWGIGAHMTMSVSKRIMLMNWTVTSVDLETNSTDVTEFYKNFAQGTQYYLLNSDYAEDTPEDFFVGGVVPLFGCEMSHKVGNYIKAIWYKD